MKASIPKYHFEKLAEAAAWLESNRGAEGEHWKRRAVCVG
jgi:hypothetical protein